VAHAYFKIKNSGKPEELAALARDPVRLGLSAGGCGLSVCGCRSKGTKPARWPHECMEGG